MTNKQNFVLDNYLWENRLLLIFAPASNDAAYTRQVSLLQGRTAEFRDRDMLMFHLFEDEPGHYRSRPIDRRTVTAVRKHFDVQPGEFAIILLGKDGGIRLRADRPTHPLGIFNLIDSMPVRRWGIRPKIREQ